MALAKAGSDGSCCPCLHSPARNVARSWSATMCTKDVWLIVRSPPCHPSRHYLHWPQSSTVWLYVVQQLVVGQVGLW